MAEVIFKNVTKVFGNKVVAVDNFNLKIEDRTFCVILGPSGCGKTTLLRMVAGLETVTSGEIIIDGKVVNKIPPKDRNVAMVFQDYALYPHMNVYDNISFGLRMRKYPKDEIKRRVDYAVEVLQIKHLLDRYPKELSGGQRQRVALARAIVRKPKIFLFDEPLSNLDAKIRSEVRTELKRFHQTIQTTVIYVTHDQLEAMTLADKIVVMKDGAIQQVGTPSEIYEKPANKFIGEFIGFLSMNFAICEVIKKSSGLFLDEGGFELLLPEKFLDVLLPGQKVILGIRPDNIYDRLYYTGDTRGNVFSAMVEVVEPLGNSTLLHINTGKNTFRVVVDQNSEVESGQILQFVIDVNKIHIFDSSTQKIIDSTSSG